MPMTSSAPAAPADRPWKANSIRPTAVSPSMTAISTGKAWSTGRPESRATPASE